MARIILRLLLAEHHQIRTQPGATRKVRRRPGQALMARLLRQPDGHHEVRDEKLVQQHVAHNTQCPRLSAALPPVRASSPDYFLPLSVDSPPVDSAATKASCGTSTRPMVFIRFLPSFCFSSSLRLREMSPP